MYKKKLLIKMIRIYENISMCGKLSSFHLENPQLISIKIHKSLNENPHNHSSTNIHARKMSRFYSDSVVV